jgi:hypothetical protein
LARELHLNEFVRLDARRLRRLIRDQDRRRHRAGDGHCDRHQHRDLEAVEEGVRGSLVEAVRQPRPAGGVEVCRDTEGRADGALGAADDRPGTCAGSASARRVA